MSTLPTKDQILAWISDNPASTSKRDIARAFGIKGAARIDLKRVLKELEGEGHLEKRKRSLLVAYLLWFFLGALGAHRFYFKKIGSGIAMVILVVFLASQILPFKGFSWLLNAALPALLIAIPLAGWGAYGLSNIAADMLNFVLRDPNPEWQDAAPAFLERTEKRLRRLLERQ